MSADQNPAQSACHIWRCALGHEHHDDPGDSCPRRDREDGSWCGAPIERQDAAMTHKPRVYIHPDGLYVSIGFNDTQDTILKVGGHEGPGGAGDVARAREWVAAVREVLGMEPQDDD